MDKQYNVLIIKESLLNEIESMFINEDFINVDKYDAKSMLIRISELIDNVTLNDDKKTININDVSFDNGAKLGDEINYLTKEFALLKDAINTIKANHKNEYGELDNKYISLDRSIDNALLPIDDLKNDVKSLKGDIKALDVFIFDEEGFPYTKSLKDSIDGMKIINQARKDENIKLQSQVNSLNDDIVVLNIY